MPWRAPQSFVSVRSAELPVGDERAQTVEEVTDTFLYDALYPANSYTVVRPPAVRAHCCSGN